MIHCKDTHQFPCDQSIRNELESNGLRKTGRESETSERVERREESERLGREERERRSLSAAVAHALLMVTRVYYPFHRTLRISNAALQ